MIGASSVVARALAAPAEVVDVLLNFGYGTVSLVAVALAVKRMGRLGLDSLIDTGILMVGASAVAWQLISAPLVESGEVGFYPAVVFPLIDVMMLGLIAQLVLGPGARTPALWAIVGGLSFALLSDVALLATDFDHEDPLVSALRTITSIFVATALNRSSMRRLFTPAARPHSRVRSLAVIACGLFFTSGIAGINVYLDRGFSSLGQALGPPVVIGLVVVRLAVVLREQERNRARLAHQATHDDLTGLPNRRRFEAQLEEALTGAGARPAVILCDIDGFSRINDALGHAAGDRLLAQVAGRLHVALVEDEAICRLGGDEFVALCNGADPAVAHDLARRLQTAVAQPFAVEHRNHVVTISVGLQLPPRGKAPQGCWPAPTRR